MDPSQLFSLSWSKEHYFVTQTRIFITSHTPKHFLFMSEQEHSSFFNQNRSTKKSHCIEVTQGVIFMEKNMRFGLFLGQLAITLRTNLLNSNNLISITVCLRILYTPVKSYVVKQPQEKWASDFHDDAPPLSFQLQVTEVIF